LPELSLRLPNSLRGNRHVRIALQRHRNDGREIVTLRVSSSGQAQTQPCPPQHQTKTPHG
jgi:hypothetical protein